MNTRSIFIKSTEWLGFGLAVWSIGLFWPGINHFPFWPVLVGLIISVNLLVIYLVANYKPRKDHKGKGTGHNPPSHPISIAPLR